MPPDPAPSISPSLSALLRLTLTPNLGPVLIRRLLSRFSSDPVKVLAASEAELSAVDMIGPATARDVLTGPDPDALNHELELIATHSTRLLPITDPQYPRLLAHTYDPPPLLYLRGTLPANAHLSLAVVGARKCSHYGRDQSLRLSAALARCGLCIVSGGAHGIDTAAHEGALQAGGRTIVVLGSGLSKPYPRENHALFDRVMESGGCLISEFPMDTPPSPENFPRRNRIISGLSLGTLVVEAASRSGALITARLACEDHNRPVFALPGKVDSPTSAGCHQIIREGWATLVTSAPEILDSLDGAQHLVGVAPPAEQQQQTAASAPAAQAPSDLRTSGLTPTQEKILAEIPRHSALPIDVLAAATGLEISRLQAEVTMLQLRGLVVRTPSSGLQRR